MTRLTTPVFHYRSRGHHVDSGSLAEIFFVRNANRGDDGNTLNYALHGMGYKSIHCAHGFRASASTIPNRQRTKEGRRRFETALIEIQQDRLDGSTRAIYDRDDLMPERVDLMQFWG